MLLQVRQLGELPLTDLTPVRLDAQVDPGVLRQVRTVRKRLVARGALVGLGFPHVDLCVKLQVRFGCKDLQVVLSVRRSVRCMLPPT